MDEKSFLNDHENYSAEKFTTARKGSNFKRFESSWVEKRAYPQLAVNALGDSALAVDARTRLELIHPQYPDLSEWNSLISNQAQLENAQLSIGFNLDDGSVFRLTDKNKSCEWVNRKGVFHNSLSRPFPAPIMRDSLTSTFARMNGLGGRWKILRNPA